MSGRGSREVTAFAPATVGNVAVGFDILGFALEEPGDRVTVRRIEEPTVRVGEIRGVAPDLPDRPDENTATVGLVQLIEDFELEHGFEVDLDKGVPLGGGMGGSAASAVAAVVAAGEWLEEPLSRPRMLEYALLGESVASDAVHGDNVAPSLYGGLTLIRSLQPVDVVSIPVPDSIRYVVVRPDHRIATEEARKVIPGKLPLASYVDQSANLAGFLAGCYRSDLELLDRSLADMLIEPHRSPLIPGFGAVRDAAVEAGAVGCSISGAGPSLFAWSHPPDSAEQVAEAMVEAFERRGIEAESWRGRVWERGARVVDS